MSVSTKQISIIHTLTHKLAMDDAAYRQMLNDNFRVNSSKLLTFAQAKILIAKLKNTVSPSSSERVQERIEDCKTKKKYDDLANRPGYMASPRQLRLIEALWMTNPAVKEKTELAMNHFIGRIAGVSHIRFVEKRQVNKIINAINHLT